MIQVPFYRLAITESEVEAVADVLRSGWLTTGGVTQQFEREFATQVGAKHAVALNSCTAALHLALEAVGLRRGDSVVVPTMTFAATAEVVRYFDAVPIFVDCDPQTLCMDPVKTRETLQALRDQREVAGLKPPFGPVRAIVPMHYGGQMVDAAAFREIGREFGVPIIDDAAHTLPAYYRESETADWQPAGSTADIACFSFYANKCITTGEGGMAVTNSDEWAARMRVMSLHGMSKDAWKRFTSEGSWYYEIVAPGFKYNLTDIASALGRQQLRRATALWEIRTAIAEEYRARLGAIPGITVPTPLSNRRHSWHLFAIQVDPNIITIGRNAFIDELKKLGIGASVHWMPLHMQPYYRSTYGYGTGLFPVAEALWPKLVSLPLFPAMRRDEIDAVCDSVSRVARR